MHRTRQSSRGKQDKRLFRVLHGRGLHVVENKTNASSGFCTDEAFMATAQAALHEIHSSSTSTTYRPKDPQRRPSQPCSRSVSPQSPHTALLNQHNQPYPVHAPGLRTHAWHTRAPLSYVSRTGSSEHSTGSSRESRPYTVSHTTILPYPKTNRTKKQKQKR